MTPNLSDPQLITRPDQLATLVKALTREPVLAVDTESNGLYAYREQVCLIQFSTLNADYLVDPLALDDLSGLAPIFASVGIEKVFHAAEYDVICLKRDFGFQFANLFDTMIAARTLGRRKVGLGNLLEAEFGVQQDKRHQRANWGQRPLPTHLLAYARMDTHYLIPLRDRLKAALQANGRWPLAAEDFERTCLVEERESNNHNPSCWRINGAHDLNPQQAAVLQELCLYRDRVAQSLDRPLFKVIPDRTLVAIAEQCPRDEHALGQLSGMSSGQMRRHKTALLAAVERGLRGKPVRPPHSPRPSDDFLARYDALRQWRKVTAQKMGVDSNVVLPRDVMDAIAAQAPGEPWELSSLMGELPWRRQQYGEAILRVLARVPGSRRRPR